MMARHFAVLFTAFLLVVSVMVPATALAGSGGKTDYAYLAGVAPAEGPDVAMAENGDRVTLTGSGTFDVTAKTATGAGTFIHKNSAGTTLGSGSWTATGTLTAFSFYGCGLPGFPNLCGGEAIIPVTIRPARGGSLDGVLFVTCLIGNPPTGKDEGVRLLVKGVINFNKSVSGETVFIQ